MTHIVILFNRSQQEMSQAIAESKLTAWLGRARKETLDSANIWTKLDHILTLPLNTDPQVLNVTPVRVELGMRDSLCHPLTDKNAVINDEQIQDFNEFFSGVFSLIKLAQGNYQLHFQQFLKFNLPIEHTPPQLSDYRVQIQAASTGLKRHLTELQAWCYQQESLWNALYLWSIPKDKALANINLDDRTESKVLSSLKVFKQANVHAAVKLVVLDELSSLSYEFMHMEQQFKDSKISQLSISFTDEHFYHLRARDFYPWWKKIFKR